jgi:carboxylesterase
VLASSFPVDGLVMMSTPYSLPADIRLRFAPLISLVRPFHPKEDPDSRDPEARDWHICYDGYPTRALVELQALVSHMREALPKVQAPALLINSRADSAVPAEHQEAIRRSLGSAVKETLWLEDSAHAITLEPERAGLYRAIADFITRLEADSS